MVASQRPSSGTSILALLASALELLEEAYMADNCDSPASRLTEGAVRHKDRRECDQAERKSAASERILIASIVAILVQGDGRVSRGAKAGHGV